MYINVFYIKMFEFNKNMENGDKNEREKLVVVVIDVVVLFVLSNKKPFGPIYIFKHVLKNNFVLFIS